MQVLYNARARCTTGGFLLAQHGTVRQSLISLLLLAQAAVFVSTTPKAANQIFNVSNGDVFRWSEVGSHWLCCRRDQQPLHEDSCQP